MFVTFAINLELINDANKNYLFLKKTDVMITMLINQ